MNIINEFEKRLEKQEDNVYQILGSEIKARRIKLSKTLESLADDCCSTSYVCKIERTLIKPNPILLSKICERININKDNLLDLYSLKQILEKTLKAFYNKDVKVLEEIFNKVKDFNNYRASLIVVIYDISCNNYYKAKLMLGELYKIKSTMIDYDFAVFSLLYTVLEIKEYNYFKCISNLEYLIKFYDDELLKAISNELIGLCLFKLSSKQSFIYLDKAISYSNKVMNFEKTMELEFEKMLLLLKLGNLDSFKLNISNFKDKTYLNTLNMLKKLSENKKIDILTKEEYVNEFYYYLALYHSDKQSFLNAFVITNEDYIMENSLFMYLKFKESQYNAKDELEELYYPYFLSTNNIYFIKEVSTLYLEKLKNISQYKKYGNVLNEVFELVEKAYLY